MGDGCSGSGADDDIVVSSARAYISAINKMLGFHESRKALRAKAEVARKGEEVVV